MLDGIQINNDVDFNSNEALNIKAHVRSDDPIGTDLVAGKFWYNTTSNSLNYYNGTNVIILNNSFATYTHNQGVAASVWNIEHNLNRYVQITIVDSGGNVVEGAESYDDLNNITIEFGAPFSGKAYLT